MCISHWKKSPLRPPCYQPYHMMCAMQVSSQRQARPPFITFDADSAPEELLEVLVSIQDIIHTCHLPDAVHAELRHAHVHSPAAQVVCQDGSNGAATGHVIAHSKLLNRHASTASHLPAQHATAQQEHAAHHATDLNQPCACHCGVYGTMQVA